MKILSCGAGVQTVALTLMSCENVIKGTAVHPHVPIYDAVIFCDLGKEPPWVYEQVEFLKKTCEKSGIFFKVLDTGLYDNYVENFGRKRVSSIPFWSVDPEGKKAKMRRQCTIDFKIIAIQKYVKHELLGYRKYQRMRPEDISAHEMHIGFSAEEQKRIFDSYHSMFVNRFPLVEMGFERSDSYKYNLEVWGLDTKASACCICPFHRNYFFEHLRQNYKENYDDVVAMDEILEQQQPNTAIRSSLFISRSRKRVKDLTPEECNDAEFFLYNEKPIWNGF